MATNAIDLPEVARPARRSREATPLDVLATILSPLSSLKLTQILFVLAIMLIFLGTFAQAKAGMWEAMSLYFKSWFVWVDLAIFFPEDWFRESMPWIYNVVAKLPKVPFFGGASIGTAMMVNLFAAHLVRFRMQARGTRLALGLTALAAGVVLTTIVVALGDFQQGLRTRPLLSWETTAILTLLGVGTTSVALLVGGVWQCALASSQGEKQRWATAGLMLAGAAVSILGCILLVMFFDDISALRILWQLIQGTVAGLALLAGCWLLFDKRAGIVLLHGGVALMMVSQLLVGLFAVEERMHIEEGETARYAFDIRESELAVVHTEKGEARHTVIPQAILEQVARAEAGKRVISHDDLPFDIEIVHFYLNSELKDPTEASSDPNPATKGLGKGMLIVERAVGAGASSDSDADMPAGYFELLEKGTEKDLGTFALSTGLIRGENVAVNKSDYDVALRFKRRYKDYRIHLKDVKKEDYPGTDTPRVYESTVQLTDKPREVDRPASISMNNPFRYLGETFYQSGYHFDPRTRTESTTLQVVTNAGWMIPYVSCMIVFVGLLFQFVQTLMRFVLNRSQDATLAATVVEKKGKRKHMPAPPAESWWGWFAPSATAIGMMLVTALVICYGMFRPHTKPGGMDIYEFGRLPVLDNGRVKPMESLARESLIAISNKTTYKGEDGKSRSALEWFLETVAKTEDAEKLQIIRIDNPEVLSSLSLPGEGERPAMRYSFEELKDRAKEYDKQIALLSKKHKDQFTTFDKKFSEMTSRARSYLRIRESFVPTRLPKMPPRELLEANDPEAFERAGAIIEVLRGFASSVDGMNPPLAVPVLSKDLEVISAGKKWAPYSVAATFAGVRMGMMPEGESKIDEPTRYLNSIFAAYGEGDSAEFNSQVQDYLEWVREHEPDHYYAGRVDFEAYLNHFAPFGWSQGILLYLVAFITSCLGLLLARRQLGSAAFWMLVITFALHTFALAARIYVSGRPPVTNLYSSAVFIGWVAVLMGLTLEGAFRLGVGNVMAAIAGLASLLIASSLSLDPKQPDTIGVMQAVLDTQFWLATHVVCITVGYAATFAAGLIGVVYIFLGLFTPILNKADGKLLARMIYGVVCFALFFSFVGTVLGGLWADDSWGRFWGWDPKENGALIIVLWNAFILHAKWDKMANERGMAVLAVIGNIVTSWSWFGTNQLKVGLHSYGFTEGVLLALGLTAGIHLVIIGLGLLPKSLWWSFRAREQEEAIAAQAV